MVDVYRYNWKILSIGAILVPLLACAFFWLQLNYQPSFFVNDVIITLITILYLFTLWIAYD